jgi:S-layer homology domain
MPPLLRLLTLSSIIAIFPNTTALAFNDTQEYWGNNCISELNSRKLITGYPNNTFRPNLTVTRAEAAVLMLNAFPDAPNKRNSTPFRDVSPTHWANKAIFTAYQKGFFSGYPGGIFQPNQAIIQLFIFSRMVGMGTNNWLKFNPTNRK